MTFDVTFTLGSPVSAQCSCGAAIAVDANGTVAVRSHLIASHGFRDGVPITFTITSETICPRRLSFEARQDDVIVETISNTCAEG